jgi:hypothetical protein
MKVLFSALHLAYFRNFESVIRELAVRGHQVHLTGDEVDQIMGGQDLAGRLSRECPGVTWELLPALADEEPWFAAARKLRLGLDYVRVLDARYAPYPKLRARSRERAPRIVRWAGELAPRRTLSALKGIERLLPPSAALLRVLRAQAPDVVVLASLTYSRSQQMDMLKAARAERIPVAAAIMSWDHLSSKALLHLHPDRMLVWNDLQRDEAIAMHATPAERIVVTGAQCYDQWFTREPSRSREAFCRDVGLRVDRPFVLWVHSAMSPRPSPPEPELVVRWIEALRASSDPRLRELGVVVRPHPERVKEWAGIDVTQFPNVVFSGRNPIDPESKRDYFDALFHSSAVVGLVTSAFLEAVIIGRPVLTLTLPEYRMHQDDMLHFQYLRNVAGGALIAAPDLDAHLEQLSAAVARPPGRDERNIRFLSAFIRPGGLEAPATPVFADAIEALQRDGTIPDPSLDGSGFAKAIVTAAASRTRGVIGWILLNDLREDERQWNHQAKRLRLAKQALGGAWRRRVKRLRQYRVLATEKARLAGKGAISWLRHAYYRVATGAWPSSGMDRDPFVDPEKK